MDPITLTTLASQVMALLTPYLTKAGEEFASKFGDAAFEQCKRLYDAVRARFVKEAPKDGGNAAQALDALAKDPDMASAVQTKLARILQADPDFANTLKQLLRSGPLQDIQVGEDSTAIGNQMRNREGEGSQTMRGGNRSTLKDNIMEIG
jgi:hypothetical protein